MWNAYRYINEEVCHINSVSWSLDNSTSGVPITLNVEGNYCEGNLINYTVYRNGILWWHNSSVMTNSSSGNISWLAGLKNDGSYSLGEYTFRAIDTGRANNFKDSGIFRVYADPSSSGLVGHWKFDETEGNTTFDSSVNLNNGLLTNNPLRVEGMIENALEFNGSNYVCVAQDSSLNLINALTVSAWVKPNSAMLNEGIVTRGITGGNTIAEQFNLKFGTSTTFRFQVSNGTNFLSTSGNLILNEWQHVVGTYNGAGNVSLYVNGTFVASSFISNFGALNSLNPTCGLLLGAGRTTCCGLNGSLDEVRVYDRALNSEEIMFLFNGTEELVDGECGLIINECDTGTLSNQGQNDTHYTWDCLGENGGSNDSCSLEIDIEIILNESDWNMSETTNLTSLNKTQLLNIKNLTFSNDRGTIRFIRNITINQSRNLTSLIKIMHHKTWINSSILYEFNKSAIIIFKNVTFINPILLRNNVECSQSICGNISYDRDLKIYSFNVTHFSMYEIQEGPTLPICGNNITEPGEACDGTDVNNYTCATVAAGFKSGELRCNADCKSYDVSSCAESAKVYATSCNIDHVASAISNAQNGSVVIIPPGNCSWDSRISIAKQGIALIGAGIGRTNISVGDNLTGSQYSTFLISINAQGVKVAGFTFLGNSQNSKSIINLAGEDFHISDNRFEGNKTYSIYASGVYGTISNNQFIGAMGNEEMIFVRGPTDSWQTNSSFGTKENLFIENNTFSGSGYVCDINSNGRAVVRNNLIEGNMKIDGHGKASNTPPRGVRHMEIYDNNWTSTASFWTALEIRGGTGVIYNNTATAPSNGASFYLTDYGYTAAWPNFGSVCQCPSDYPVDDQIGVGKDTKAAASEPLYIWNNLRSDVEWNLSWKSVSACEATCGSFILQDVIQEGIDYKIEQKLDYYPYPYPNYLVPIKYGICTLNLDCDDSNPCTDELCEPFSDDANEFGCVYTFAEGSCDDGSSCTTGDSCSLGICSGTVIETCANGDGCCHELCDDSDCAPIRFASYDFNNNVLDAMGNHNGENFGADCSVSGKFDQGCNFNGSTYLRIGRNGNFSDICANGCSFSSWVNPSGDGTIIARSDFNERLFELRITTSGTKVLFSIGDNGADANVCLVQEPGLAVGEWNHIAGVYDGDKVILYIDGKEVDRTTCNFLSINLTSWQNINEDTFVGRRDQSSPEYYFNGTIDQLQVWNSSLNASLIRSLYDHSCLSVGTDTTPPSSVTNLANISSGTTWIYWNWTNPADSDFNSTIVFLNVTNVANLTSSVNYYNATGLSPGTNYTITIWTRDHSGNVNDTDNSDTASTLEELSQPICGNNITEPGEACDGTDVNNYTCATVAAGFKSGTLSCSSDCKSYDVSQCVQGDVIRALSCNQSDVQNAIDLASDGDIVVVPEGECMWSYEIGCSGLTQCSSVHILDKSILLKGSGIGKTIINVNLTSGWDKNAIYVNSVTNKPFRISGFTFNGSNFNTIVYIRGTNKNWRIDNSEFNNSQGSKVAINNRDYNYGLIDNSTFRNMEVLIEEDGNDAWMRNLTFGTANAVILEDNFFMYLSDFSDVVDSRRGSKYVFRHNNVLNGYVHAHDGCTAGTRGSMSYEIYNNTLVSDSNVYRPFYIRSGTGVIFNNNVFGDYNVPGIHLDEMRASSPESCHSNWDACNGSSIYDGNELPNGYPCRDQIGRSTDLGITMPQQQEPAYEWNNFFETQNINFTLNPSSAYIIEDYIVEGRDYLNDVEKPDYISYVYPHPLSLIDVEIEEEPSQEIIPAERRINWSNAGIPGGIPNRTTICATIDAEIYGDGVTDATQVITDAISNCPADQVVYIPEGIYNLTSRIYFNSKNRVSIRGDGPYSTILESNGGSETFLFGRSEWNVPSNRIMAIESGFFKGSNEIIVNTTTNTGIAVGQLIMINELNNYPIVNNVGSTGGVFTGDRDHDGTRVQWQITKITNIDGNTITFEPSLHWTLQEHLEPQATVMPYSAYQIGIEDLAIKNNAGATTLVSFSAPDQSWVKNVRFIDIQRNGIQLYLGLQSEIRDCIFEGVYENIYTVGRGYSIEIPRTSSSLITNNIFYRQRATVHTHYGASGNVVSYNYVYDARDSWANETTGLVAISANHGAHPKMNLFEGNKASRLQADYYWGSGGFGMLFRNHFTGTDVTIVQNRMAISIDRRQLNYSIIGNIVGDSAISDWVYMPTTNGHSYSTNVLYRIGYPHIGNNAYNSDPEALDGYDPKVKETLLLHGNYDYYHGCFWDDENGLCVEESSLSIPDSLYLSSKPSWWDDYGELNYPAFGPDTDFENNKIPAQARFEQMQIEDPSNTLVTNLQSTSKWTRWIHWTWTNPIYVNFSENIIYINGINVANTSETSFNATGLESDTEYTIRIHTKYANGSVEDEYNDDTVRTLEAVPLPAIWYKFEGNLFDSSGNHNHASCVNCPELSEDRHENANSAYHFNNSGQYLTAGDVFEVGENDFSIVLWFKKANDMTSDGQIEQLIGKSKSQYYISNSGWVAVLRRASGLDKLRFQVRGDEGNVEIISNEVIEKDVWYFMVIVKTNESVSMYLNDNPVKSSSVTLGYINTTGEDLIMGIGRGLSSFSLNGTIDEIRLYDSALSHSQVERIYQGLDQEDEEPCIPDWRNTTWTSPINVSCSNGQMNQSSNLTQYDDNNCPGSTNTTFFNYTLVGPLWNYTDWSDWQSIGCSGTDLNFTRNRTQQDIYGCAESIIHHEYNITEANITFTDWSDWTNLTCESEQMNQSKFRTEYDDNYLGCFMNATHYEYRLVGPVWNYTDWSDWQNIECLPSDLMNQSRYMIQSDVYSCSEDIYHYEYRQEEYCQYDTVPPSSVSNLQNTTTGSTWIYWTWTNPLDDDYHKAIIFINDINKVNITKPENSYNATNLEYDTEYTIKIHTIDYSSNINDTDVTALARTLSCIPGWRNTTWTSPINVSCSGDQMNQSSNLTQYDYNNCPGSTNTTFFNYTLVGPVWNYTDWSDWQSIGCYGTDLNFTRNMTQQDTYGCAESIIHHEYNITEANITFTDWSDWTNLSCESEQMNQSKFRTEYDDNHLGCFMNVSHYDYQLVGPELRNTTFGDWVDDTCIDNYMQQIQNATQYDIYGCIDNTTVFNNKQSGSCGKVLYNITYLKNNSNISYANLSNDNLSISLDRNLFFNDVQSGIRDVEILLGDSRLVHFDHNFSMSDLNISMTKLNLGLFNNKRFIIVSGINNSRHKTISLIANSLSSNAVCLVDSNIETLQELTDNCIILNCPGSLGNWSCTKTETTFDISGLTHSGVIEHYIPDPDDSGRGTGGPSGGGSTTTTTQCTTEWVCTEWSECINNYMRRECHIKDENCIAPEKPVERIECKSISEPISSDPENIKVDDKPKSLEPDEDIPMEIVAEKIGIITITAITSFITILIIIMLIVIITTKRVKFFNGCIENTNTKATIHTQHIYNYFLERYSRGIDRVKIREELMDLGYSADLILRYEEYHDRQISIISNYISKEKALGAYMENIKQLLIERGWDRRIVEREIEIIH
jgi:hypothetical protein